MKCVANIFATTEKIGNVGNKCRARHISRLTTLYTQILRISLPFMSFLQTI